MSSEVSTTGLIDKGAYVSDWAPLSEGKWVHRYNICGTTFLDYEVYEPTTFRRWTDERGIERSWHSHSTYTYKDTDTNTRGYIELGDITTRNLPAEIEALPAGSTVRIEAVRAWYDRNKAEARALIYATFPNDFFPPRP